MLIVLARKDWPNRVYDGSVVMENLMLAAHALGVGRPSFIHYLAQFPEIMRKQEARAGRAGQGGGRRRADPRPPGPCMKEVLIHADFKI